MLVGLFILLFGGPVIAMAVISAFKLTAIASVPGLARRAEPAAGPLQR